MENASDALKMAFAMFVFVIALSIVFSLFSKIKQTADSIMYHSDETNYYEWETGNLDNGRIVGIDTVIATLKNYRAQSSYVIIEEGGSKKEFNYGATMDDEINNYIKNNINSNDRYLENIREITTGGKYRIAEDGTKITIKPGTTRIYIIYTKI